MCRIKKSAAMVLAAVGMVFAQWQNLFPVYNGLATDGSKFIAVSGDGLIRTTTDGATWPSHRFINDEDGNTRQIYAVAFGGGRFVAVQNNSNYLYSGDGGVNWNSVQAGPGANIEWKHLAYGEPTGTWGFVAVSASGKTALFDDDGWQIADAATPLSHVAGARRFVAVGDGIRRSSDGRGWGGTAGIPASEKIAVVAYDNVAGKFVALSKDGAKVYTSTDSENWTSATAAAAPDMADMVFANGKFVAVGKAGKASVSGDGSSWSVATLNPDDDFKAVKFANNAFLALGAGGSVYKSDANGANWERKSGSSVASYKQIAFGGGKYMAVGDLGVWVSDNGKKWEKSNVEARNLNGVAFGAGKFVAAGDNGAIITYDNAGDRWTDYSVGAGENLTSVAFGDGVFMIGGKTGSGSLGDSYKPIIYRSEDGANWDVNTLTDMSGWDEREYVNSLCYGNGKFLAAVGGKNGALRIGGKNGLYWEVAQGLSAAADYPMISTVYAENKFIAVGTKSDGVSIVLNSADAENWQALPSEVRKVRSATLAAIGGSPTYIAVADSGNIYATVNGSWYLQSKVTNRNLSTVYSGGGFALAAGAKGAMLFSDAPPTSVKHASAPRAAKSSKGGLMSLNRAGRTSAVTLSFTPVKAGAITVYSLNGRQLYKTRLGAGERSALLPERVMSNGSVIVRYSGEGRNVSQRFQIVR